MDSRQLTGIPGLDAVLGGGLVEGSCTLLSGAAGTGKTTLGLQYLCAGAALGEGGAYITFEEFPEQIYRDAASFGWDIPALEGERTLQVICMDPKVFLSEALEVDGLLEELQAELGLKRIVIDSLNLMHLAIGTQETSHLRRNFYLVRNAFRRLGLTSLVLHERHSECALSTTDDFVADTVIHLSYDSLEEHRVRHLEVMKHRGSTLLAGKHVFVFSPEGIRLLAALNRIPDLPGNVGVPTGLTKLDERLSGGISRGSIVAMSVNSKCNYRVLVGSMIAAHLRQGYGLVWGRSGLSTPEDVAALIQLYGTDPLALGAAGRFIALDFADRPTSPDLEPYVIRQGTDAERDAATQAEFYRRFAGPGAPSHWILVVDLNTLLLQVGPDAFIKTWIAYAGAMRHAGHTIIALCNFEEMGQQMTAFVQRCSHTMIKTWFDGRYQYLQVMKSPNGRVSEPMVIEYVPELPYVALW